MSKLFFFTIMMAIASVASVGVLGVNFDMIAQALSVFDTEDVGLDGCECVDAAGNPTTCDPDVLANYPLCQVTPPP